MGKYVDITGLVSGKLTVISYSHSGTGTYWKCQCQCGNVITLPRQQIVEKRRTTCGNCYNHRHFLTNTSEYHIWRNIIDRCYNKDAHDYLNYGGRGIKVFNLWKSDFKSFYDYLKTLPETKFKFEIKYNTFATLDRINVNGNYEPGNLRWCSRETQAQNRTNNVLNEQMVKFILWEKQVNKQPVTEVFELLKTTFKYNGSIGAVRDAFYRQCWKNVNIDFEIGRYSLIYLETSSCNQDEN